MAFDSLQQAFRKQDIDNMFDSQAPTAQLYEAIYVFVDPAAGGPSSDYAIMSITRTMGVAIIIGIDILSGCKDPEKQFKLLVNHIKALQNQTVWRMSNITVFVEHNLGFEAEHHERALRGMPNVRFYRDMQRQRVGVLTTLQTKHAMCTLTNAMLREKRICVRKDLFVSNDRGGMMVLLRDELNTYSYQFKSAATVFSRDQCALSGKNIIRNIV